MIELPIGLEELLHHAALVSHFLKTTPEHKHQQWTYNALKSLFLFTLQHSRG
jgi:hypothetical protein